MGAGLQFTPLIRRKLRGDNIHTNWPALPTGPRSNLPLNFIPQLHFYCISSSWTGGADCQGRSSNHCLVLQRLHCFARIFPSGCEGRCSQLTKVIPGPILTQQALSQGNGTSRTHIHPWHSAPPAGRWSGRCAAEQV